MGIVQVFLLMGGLGMFLYGMKMMSDGLEQAAGDRMRRTLEALTTNRFAGVAVGAGVTAVVQSSSATTVMVVGFVNAGLMTLLQATGVIMGANIGTTITAQIIAFKLSDIAPLFIFVGMVLNIFIKKRLVSRIGYIIVGFGVLFVGMNLMSQAMLPLQENEAFRHFLVNFRNPIVGVAVGAIFTAVLQSSSASVGILQALAMLGLIGLDNAVYVILGQNIGTCITAVLAAIGTSANSKRTAGIHLMFNIIGTIIFLIVLAIFPAIPDWVKTISGDNASRQIANFHTIFNITVTILLFPFAKQMVWLITKILPEKPDPNRVEKKLLYLDDRIAQTPAIALTQTIRELTRLGRIASSNLSLAIEAFFEKDESKANRVLEVEKTINFLNHEIIDYLVRIRALELPEHDMRVLGGLYHVVSDIERVGDHAENIAEYTLILIEGRIKMSQEGTEELKVMADKVMETLNACLDLFERRDLQHISTATALEEEVDGMQDQFIHNHISRLQDRACHPQAGVVFTDMITDLERVADHAINIAYSLKD